MRLKRLLQDPFMVVWAKKLTVAWSSKVSMHFDGKMCRYVPYKSIVVNCPSTWALKSDLEDFQNMYSMLLISMNGNPLENHLLKLVEKCGKLKGKFFKCLHERTNRSLSDKNLFSIIFHHFQWFSSKWNWEHSKTTSMKFRFHTVLMDLWKCSET